MQQVTSTQNVEIGNLVTIVKSFEKLLKSVENTHAVYDSYLTTTLNNQDDHEIESNSILSKNQMEKKLLDCRKEYKKEMSKNLITLSKNNNTCVLTYNMNDIQQIIENKLIVIESQNNNNQSLKKLANINSTRSIAKLKNKNDHDSLYEICQFDLKYTRLIIGSTIDCDNKHIKIGSNSGHCYSMILPDKNHMFGYTSGHGQHCFRMYYKNPKGPHEWLLFGIYKYGVVPKDMKSYNHETSWGIVDGGYGAIYCNGKYEIDKFNMSFLYSLNENQIDMFVDFDKGMLSYAIVDDNFKNRNYTFEKKVDTNIAYTVNIGFGWSRAEVQIAKIKVAMFGKNGQS